MLGTLILHLSPEKSFWMFVTMMRRNGPYRLQSLFLPGQPQVIVSLYCLDRLIELFLPSLFSHFKKVQVTPILFAHAWFCTLFGYTFPPEFTQQVWTVFFVSGKTFLFRVAIAILKLLEAQLLKLAFEEALDLLKKGSTSLNVFRVIEEADKFVAIDIRLVKRIKKEAIKVLKASKLQDVM